MSKRILSVALAVVMLFSVCAIAASAALSTGEYGIVLYTDAEPGMPAGSTVHVTAAYKYPAGYDVTSEKQTAAMTAFCWNNTVYEYTDYEWLVTNSSGDVFFKYNAPTTTAAVYTAIQSKFSATDKANEEKYGWNQVGMFQQAYDTTSQSEITSNTGYTAVLDSNNEMKYITITFTTLKQLTENDVVGITDGSKTNKNTQIKVRQGKTNVTITADKTIITDALAVPKVGFKVFDAATKVRANGANFDLGFTGYFNISDFAPAFDDAGHSADIDAVGVEITINDVTNEYTDRWVYDGPGADQLQFRAVLSNIPASDKDVEIAARMFVTYKGEKFYSEGITTTLAEHMDRVFPA